MTFRTFSGLLALASATLLAGACAGNDETAFGVACVPGTQTSCDCANGETGVQICQPDGNSVGDCLCAPPPPEGGAGSGGSGGSGGAPQAECTLFPKCEGCHDCWETCICQTSGDVKGCKKTCLVDAGATDAGGTCDPAQCPPATGVAAQFATACCTSASNCGLSITALGASCQEKNQPGTTDPNCPATTLMGFSVQGCCRPNHICGLKDPILGLGCVDPTAFGQPKGPSC